MKVFFVLSGFLITSIILAEHAHSGGLNLKYFYARRALRLGPALVLTLVLTGILLVAIPDLRATIDVPIWLALVSTCAYFNNWVSAFANASTGPFAQTWSLSVEEQFYLIWPPILALMIARLARNGLIRVIVCAIAALAAFRVVMELHFADRDVAWEFATTSSADGLLVGCLAALLLHSRPTMQVPRWTTTAAFAAILVSMFTVSGHTLFLNAGFLTPFALLCGVLILGVTTDQGSQVARLMSVKPLRFTGRISYGLYLYHWPIFLAITTAFPAQTEPHNRLWFIVTVAVSWALTFAVSIASFFWVEDPILRLKRARFTPPRDDVAPHASDALSAEPDESVR